MKIIFLDIDGVLNDSVFLHSDTTIHTEGWNWIGMIDPTKVALLNQIIKATQAKIIISSSWRIRNTQEQLQSYLDHHGFVGKIIGLTPIKLSNSYRGNEIKWYLHRLVAEGIDVETFVILDDNSDMYPYKDYLIQTSFTPLIGDDSGGLQQRHADEAIKRLK